MILFESFLYYTLFASIVLIYGIGINRIVEIGITSFSSFMFYFKAILSIISTSVLSWLVTNYILLPLNLVEIFPLLCVLIFICISSFIEALVRITTGTSAPEFIVSFLIVLLSIFESNSLLNSIVICFSCFISLLIIVPFCFTFKKRVCSNGHFLNENYYSLFFIFIAVIILMITVFDICWFNKGVIQ